MDHIYNRNLKSLDNKTGKRITDMISKFVSTHEKYKNCYFWKNTGNANQRRKQEFNDRLEFILNGVKYDWRQSLEISCKNFYYTSQIFMDGTKKDIRIFKKLIKGE